MREDCRLMDISLSTFWGWHFHRVLKDLRELLNEELELIGQKFNCQPSRRIELFRRSWLEPQSNELWFRWCFFDPPSDRLDMQSLDRLEAWRANNDAKDFIYYLSQGEIYKHFSEGTQHHISRLCDAFFSPNSNVRDFLEDWRAVYLQLPTCGAILDHLWENVRQRAQRTPAFIVTPRSSTQQGDGEFPPFDFSFILDVESGSDGAIHIEKQKGIKLPQWNANPSLGTSAARFFQSELFVYFFDPEFRDGSTVDLHHERNLEFFLYFPIHLRRKNKYWEWSGLLQFEFNRTGKDGDTGALMMGNDEKVRRSLVRIGRIVQILSNDILLAHVQELFDRKFTDDDNFQMFKADGLSIILGSNDSEGETTAHAETYTQLEQLFDFEIERARVKIDFGQQKQRANFAHQASAVIDSIVQSFDRLSEEVLTSMGGELLAKLYLLRSLINSYRTKYSRVSVGNFQYPWKDDVSPLAVYRDIGIQLGLARAQDASEEEEGGMEVRKAGRAALNPENQLGLPGFEVYRDLFEPLPNVSFHIREHLKHSSFAMLIILVLKQAVYHTLKARVLVKASEKATILISVKESDGSVIFECKVENPKVTDKDQEKKPKDVKELSDLADRLSNIGDDPSTYSVDGPSFNSQNDRWVTTTRIHAKK